MATAEERAAMAELVKDLASELNEAYDDDYLDDFIANHLEHHILAAAHGDIAELVQLRVACGLPPIV